MRKPKTLEEIKREIRDYKEDLNYCINGLEVIRYENYEKRNLDPVDAYWIGESEVHLKWQDFIIKDLLKIIKTIK